MHRSHRGHGGTVSHDESDDGAAETVSAGYAGRAKVGLDLSMHDSRANHASNRPTNTRSIRTSALCTDETIRDTEMVSGII